ncbi:MAG: hypothetical protein HOQ29_11860 [Acidobacteria bacterium]|nr:hypothetical protein [Acidobacteriota bacterium]
METKFRWIAVAGLALLLGIPTLANGQDIFLANPAAADLTWKGTAANANAGLSMDLGVVSNDTRRDLIVGAPGSSGLAGTVYIIFGGPNRTGDLTLASADTIITSSEAGNRFGAATAVGNVLNQEGSTPRNLAIGAPGASGGRGVVYVFNAGFSSGATRTEANAVLRVIGQPGDQLGSALATADLDDDGFRELIIGAPGSSHVYIIKGGALSGTIDLAATPGAAIPLQSAGFGTVLQAGDVTGDGISDLLVGAPSQNVVFLYHGTPGPKHGTVGAIPTVPASSFSGIAPGDEAGVSIRILDINDDGKDDLAISAPGRDGPDGRTNAGAVYVYLSPIGPGARVLSSADIVFYGAGPNHRAGALLAAGDINRDTPNDLVIGASGAAGGAGELDIYYGRKSGIGTAVGPQRVVDLSIAGQANRHIFGDPGIGAIGSVQVFEVTGEGARDIIVGVPAEQANAGKLYFTISPKLRVAPTSIAIAVGENGTNVSGTSIDVVNRSIVSIGWEATGNTSWLSALPAAGTIDQTHAGSFNVGVNAGGLAPGVYTGKVNVSASSPDLTMTIPVNVTMTVTGARVTIDAPANGAIVSNGFSVSGWAIDTSAATGTGVSQVMAYAYPVDGGRPLFAGVASYGGSRPDVAAAFGARFNNSGFSLTVRNLVPGTTYQFVVFAKSTVTNTLAGSKTVNISVSSSSAAPGPNPTDPNDTPPPNPNGGGSGGGNVPGPNTRVAINRTGLFFGAAGGGAVRTPAQTAAVSFTNGSGTWSVTTDASWLAIAPSSGAGAGVFSVSVQNGSYPPGTVLNGTITVTAPGVANSPLTIPVQLKGFAAGGNPTGLIDTPAEGVRGVVGAIPVTGWAVDDIGITQITIWRDPVPGEISQPKGVFIGNAVQVEGARPDVDAAYSLPFDYKAGWGYMLLTNMLPGGGNGPYRLSVYAEDIDNHSVLIGTRTFVCDNAHATKPFGSIDTPTQGGNASGTAFVNFGWALTPMPNMIPANGSTINVFIDGVPMGHPTYNNARSDIQTLFPGRANTNGAVGVFQFDTTKLANGVHTIAWGVIDNAGNAEGIGSRFFTVLNGASASVLEQAVTEWTGMVTTHTREAAPAIGAAVGQDAASIQAAPVAPMPAYVQSGFAPNAPLEIVEAPAATAPSRVSTQELGLLRVTIGAPVVGPDDQYEGYLIKGGKLDPLPAGSFLDRKSGEFFWQPGVGFVGTYDFVFVRNAFGTSERIPVSVEITSRRDDTDLLLPARAIKF